MAQIQNKSHKCLISLNGMAMIERVIRAVANTEPIKRIYVSIEDPQILREVSQVSDWLDDGTILPIKSEGNLAQSLINAVQQIPEPYPLIFTAGDNALHTSEMLTYFCAKVSGSDADAHMAITRAQLILDKYPKGARAFHRLRDDAYSSCNLYAATNEVGMRGVKPFATGGQFGKKPWRIAKGFGLLTLLLYKIRWLSLAGAMDRISKVIKAKAEAVLMPWAEGPIDVDSPRDFDLVTEILKQVEGDKGASAETVCRVGHWRAHP